VGQPLQFTDALTAYTSTARATMAAAKPVPVIDQEPIAIWMKSMVVRTFVEKTQASHLTKTG